MKIDTLSAVVFPNVFIYLGLSLLYLYLHYQFKERYMGIWGVGWLCACLRIVLDFMRFNGYESIPLLIFNQQLTIIAVMLLLWGMYNFMGRGLPTGWLVCGVSATGLASTGLIFGLPFHVATVPTAFYLLAGHLWMGVQFLRSWAPAGVGKYVTGYANIFLGSLVFCYPLLVREDHTYSTIIFFAIGIILCVVTLIGTLLVYFERIRYDLSTNEQRFRLLVENAKDVVYRYNLNSGGRFDYISPSVYMITGYRPEELYKFPEVLSEIIGKDYHEYINRISITHNEQVKPFKIHTKDGKETWLEQTYVPIYDHLDKLIAIEGIVRDITERRRLEKEMVHLAGLRLTGETAAGIAHEVRNPLTTVRGFLQIMAQKFLFNKYHGIIQLMISELDRANSIITNFLAFSRGQSHQTRVGNLTKLISDITPLVESNALVSGKQIRCSLGETPDFEFDENEIKQMVLNLVQNGLEAMELGGTLVLQTFYEEGYIRLVVRDQGPGMSKDTVEKLGTPFFTTKENGTGLGVAVCYGIAARHQATIALDTGKNGTSFTVSFKVSF